ncbi:biotin/lipoyl-containing protein [Micromonospora sp. NPDC048871]|uniref:biotin/lipoyl-containing protein n=1 Tax=Micromonospora sp. NPDC048871 TaxID=3364259 RepID=UPI003714EBCD
MPRTGELDDVVRLTTRRSWALLTAVLLALGVGGTWAVVARIESTVSVEGILLAGRGPTVVTAPATATVASVEAVTGRPVAAGEVLLTLRGDDETIEVTSPVAGFLSTLTVRPGDSVKGGATLGAVDRAEQRLSALLLLDAGQPAGIPAGTPVRGAGLSGTVTQVEAYPLSTTDLADRYGILRLPGYPDERLVRPVLVDLGVSAWPGATLTPVRLDLIVGTDRPLDVLLGGGR